MRRDEEVILLEELVGLKQKKQLFLDDLPTSNPVDDYTDATRFSAEMKQLFDRMPLIIAHASNSMAPTAFFGARSISDHCYYFEGMTMRFGDLSMFVATGERAL